MYLAIFLFEYIFYLPLLVALAIMFAITFYRMRGLRVRLPKPYGSGMPVYVGPRQTARTGLLILLGGIVLIVLPLASVFFLPPIAFFTLVFGLISGLPLSEIAFFIAIVYLERLSRSSLFSLTEESERDGKTLLIKTVEMRKHSDR